VTLTHDCALAEIGHVQIAATVSRRLAVIMVVFLSAMGQLIAPVYLPYFRRVS